MKDDLLARFARYSLADMVRGMDEHFPGEPFALRHLFLEERRGVLARVIAAVLDKHEETFRTIWEEKRKLVRYLRQADAPIPEALASWPATCSSRRRWPTLAAWSGARAIARARVRAGPTRRAALGLTLDLQPARPRAAARRAERARPPWRPSPRPSASPPRSALVEDAAARWGCASGCGTAQNRFFETWRARGPRPGRRWPRSAAALGFNCLRRLERPPLMRVPLGHVPAAARTRPHVRRRRRAACPT